MRLLYAAHAPFVILFLLFVAGFILSNGKKPRGSQ
jgi:hypothetical protein